MRHESPQRVPLMPTNWKPISSDQGVIGRPTDRAEPDHSSLVMELAVAALCR